MGGERDGDGSRLLPMSHRPGAVPARRENVVAQGSQPLQHGRGEPRLRDGDRQAGRSGRSEGGEKYIFFLYIIFNFYF